MSKPTSTAFPIAICDGVADGSYCTFHVERSAGSPTDTPMSTHSQAVAMARCGGVALPSIQAVWNAASPRADLAVARLASAASLDVWYKRKRSEPNRGASDSLAASVRTPRTYSPRSTWIRPAKVSQSARPGLPVSCSREALSSSKERIHISSPACRAWPATTTGSGRSRT